MSEPSLMSAMSELEAAEARYEQSAGGLLPQVRASANTAKNRRAYTTLPQPADPRAVDPGTEQEQRQALSGRAQEETEHGRYNASGGEISLTLALYRPVAYWDKRQSATVVQQASREVEAARQELIHRVVDAWLEVLSAQLELRMTGAKEAAAERQLLLVRKGSALGAYAQPDLEEALSRHRSAQAEHLGAAGQLRLRKLALDHLVGTATEVPDVSARLTAGAEVPDLLVGPAGSSGPRTLDELEALVLSRNPSIQAGEQALVAAEQAVNRSQAGHLPTLDFTASASRNRQGLGTSAGQSGFKSVVRSVALDLKIPLYSGGTDTARVREEVAKLQGAEHALEAARRKALSELHQAWYTGEVARARMVAAEQAVRAGQALLKQAEHGVALGMKSEIDVVQARVQLETAWRDHQRAISDQLRSAVRIRTLLADMDVGDLAAIDTFWFAPATSLTGQPQLPGPRS